MRQGITIAPDDRFIRLPEVSLKIGMSRATIYRMIDQGRFPKQVQLGRRSSAWILSELNAWMAERIEKRSV